MKLKKNLIRLLRGGQGSLHKYLPPPELEEKAQNALKRTQPRRNDFGNPIPKPSYEGLSLGDQRAMERLRNELEKTCGLTGDDLGRFSAASAYLLKNSKGKWFRRWYRKVKNKSVYAAFTPWTFAELKRLSLYRVAGFSSAPLTLTAVIGFSMPCAVCFSMLEMYSPDKFKYPCKVMKWAGGAAFFVSSSVVDHVSGYFEEKYFGEEVPIDMPTLMGTMPTLDDAAELAKVLKDYQSKGYD